MDMNIANRGGGELVKIHLIAHSTHLVRTYYYAFAEYSDIAIGRAEGTSALGATLGSAK